MVARELSSSSDLFGRSRGLPPLASDLRSLRGGALFDVSRLPRCIPQLVLKGRSVAEPPAAAISAAAIEDRHRTPQLVWFCRGRLSGRLGTTFHAFLWLWLVLVLALLEDGDLPRDGAAKRKFARAFAPLWTAWALLVASLFLVIRRHRTQAYRLMPSQLAAATLYVCSACFFAVAVAALLGVPFAERASNRCLENLGPRGAAACCTAGAICAAVGLRVAFVRHAHQLVRSRGHGQPLPLARTPEGYWGVSGAGESFWFLLGSFERAAPNVSPSLLALARTDRWCVSLCRAGILTDVWVNNKACAACSRCGGHDDTPHRGSGDGDDDNHDASPPRDDRDAEVEHPPRRPGDANHQDFAFDVQATTESLPLCRT